MSKLIQNLIDMNIENSAKNMGLDSPINRKRITPGRLIKNKNLKMHILNKAFHVEMNKFKDMSDFQGVAKSEFTDTVLARNRRTHTDDFTNTKRYILALVKD